MTAPLTNPWTRSSSAAAVHAAALPERGLARRGRAHWAPCTVCWRPVSRRLARGDGMRDARWLCRRSGPEAQMAPCACAPRARRCGETHGTALRHFATALAHCAGTRAACAHVPSRRRPRRKPCSAARNGSRPVRQLARSCWLIENGVFIDCNRAAIHMLGYTRREDILQHPSRLSPEKQPDGRLSLRRPKS